FERKKGRIFYVFFLTHFSGQNKLLLISLPLKVCDISSILFSVSFWRWSMGIRKVKSPWPTRTFRPNIMRLEDRVVPGEMFGPSMLWAMGAFADPAALMPDNGPNDRTPADTPASSVRADADTPSLPYVDSSTLSICQADAPSAGDSGASQSSQPASV